MRSLAMQLAVLLALLVVVRADIIPFQNCSTTPSHIQVSSVTMTPFPAQAGSTTQLNITGALNQPVADGTFSMTIVFMGAPVYNKTGKVCEMGWFSCPAPQGPITLIANFSLPSFIPQGDFGISANLTAPDGSSLLCISFVMPVRRPKDAGDSIAATDFSAAWWEEQVRKSGANVGIAFSSAPAPSGPEPSAKPSDHTKISINDDTTSESAEASTPPAEGAAEASQAVSEATEAPAESTEASASPSEGTETVAEAAAPSEATEATAVAEESTAAPSEAASEAVEAPSSEEAAAPAPASAEEAEASTEDVSLSIPAAELSERPVPTIPSPKGSKGKARSTAHLVKQAKALEEEFDSIAAEVDQAANDLEHHGQKQPHVTLLVSEDAAQDGMVALPMIIKQVQEALGKGDAYLLPSSPANTVTIPLRPAATDAAPSSSGTQWPWSHDWELGDVEWTTLDKEAADTSHKKLAEIHHRYANEEDAPRPSKKKKSKARVEEPSHITFPFAFVNSDDSSTTNVEADTADSDHGVNYFLPNLVHALSRVGHDHEDQEVEVEPQQHGFEREQRHFERDDRVLPVVAGQEDQSLRDYFQQAYGQIADVLSLPSNNHFTVSDHNSGHGQEDNPHGLAFPFPPSFRFVQ